MSPVRPDRRRALGAMAGSALVMVAGRSLAGPEADPAAAEVAARLIAQLAGASPYREGGVRLTLPALADSGHSVPVTIDVASPMTADEYVKSIHLIAPRNPRPLAASFHFSPHSGRAMITTRMRLAGEQEVVALAIRSDGTHCLARAMVVVTVSACLDGT